MLLHKMFCFSTYKQKKQTVSLSFQDAVTLWKKKLENVFEKGVC